MADAVATQTMIDGARLVVMKFTDISDGTGEAAVLKVDVSTLAASPAGATCTGVKIRRIRYATFGMGVDVLWDATTDVLCWHLPADTVFDLEFDDLPLLNNSGAGKTGDVMFTTLGHSAGDRYTIELEMEKEYAF